LFETGAHSDAAVRAYARTARQISSSSFAAFVYDHMPNGTDFTVAKRAGLPGFNFAFIGDPAQYHTAIATPDALSIGSLQNIGDLVLASVLSLDAGTGVENHSGPLVWADFLGQRIIAYPAWVGWVLVIVIAVLLVIASVRVSLLRRIGAAARGVVLALVLMIVASLALYAAQAIAMFPDSPRRIERLLLLCSRFELALLLIAFGAGLVATRLCSKLADEDAEWLGLLIIGLIALTALQSFAPQLTPPLAWPLLAATCGVMTMGDSSRLGSMWSMLTATLSFAMTLDWAHGVYLGIGIFTPVVLVIFVLVGSFAMVPLWVRASRGGYRVGLVVLGAGLAVALSLRLS
jgi:hypothetical protein